MQCLILNLLVYDSNVLICSKAAQMFNIFSKMHVSKVVYEKDMFMDLTCIL